VLLLCAGEGSRLRPLTFTTPKCLVPVLGRPLLDYWVELFTRGPKPARLWLNKSYLSEQVDRYVEALSDLNLPFALSMLHEPELLGTAGTLRKLLCAESFDCDLLVAHGDNLTWFDLEEFLAFHSRRKQGVEMTMMTFDTDSPQSCGVVELDDQGIVRTFHEKVENPPSSLANAAVYLFAPAALERVRRLGRGDDISRDMIPHFIGRAQTWKNSVYHRDIGTPLSYEQAQVEFKKLALNLGVGQAR